MNENTKQKIAWENYSEAYNNLSDEISEAGIENMKLRKVVDLHTEYMELCQSFCQSNQ